MKATYRLDYDNGDIGLLRVNGPQDVIETTVATFKKLGARVTAIQGAEIPRARRLINQTNAAKRQEVANANTK